uniref:Uncharacterized protein n=1 Tax=Tetranychus urticae TaxID=32264 RepID=T1KH07_TETUR
MYKDWWNTINQQIRAVNFLVEQQSVLPQHRTKYQQDFKYLLKPINLEI